MTYDRFGGCRYHPRRGNPVLQRTEQFARWPGRPVPSACGAGPRRPDGHHRRIRPRSPVHCGRCREPGLVGRSGRGRRLAGRRNRSSRRDRQRDRTRRCCRRGNPAARQGAGCRPHYAGLFSAGISASSRSVACQVWRLPRRTGSASYMRGVRSTVTTTFVTTSADDRASWLGSRGAVSDRTARPATGDHRPPGLKPGTEWYPAPERADGSLLRRRQGKT